MSENGSKKKVIVFIDGTILCNWLKGHGTMSPDFGAIYRKLSHFGEIVSVYYFDDEKKVTPERKEQLTQLGYTVLIEQTRAKAVESMAYTIGQHTAEADHFVLIGSNEKFAEPVNAIIISQKTVELVAEVASVHTKLLKKNRPIMNVKDFLDLPEKPEPKRIVVLINEMALAKAKEKTGLDINYGKLREYLSSRGKIIDLSYICRKVAMTASERKKLELSSYKIFCVDHPSDIVNKMIILMRNRQNGIDHFVIIGFGQELIGKLVALAGLGKTIEIIDFPEKVVIGNISFPHTVTDIAEVLRLVTDTEITKTIAPDPAPNPDHDANPDPDANPQPPDLPKKEPETVIYIVGHVLKQISDSESIGINYNGLKAILTEKYEPRSIHFFGSKLSIFSGEIAELKQIGFKCSYGRWPSDEISEIKKRLKGRETAGKIIIIGYDARLAESIQTAQSAGKVVEVFLPIPCEDADRPDCKTEDLIALLKISEKAKAEPHYEPKKSSPTPPVPPPPVQPPVPESKKPDLPPANTTEKLVVFIDGKMLEEFGEKCSLAVNYISLMQYLRRQGKLVKVQFFFEKEGHCSASLLVQTGYAVKRIGEKYQIHEEISREMMAIRDTATKVILIGGSIDYARAVSYLTTQQVKEVIVLCPHEMLDKGFVPKKLNATYINTQSIWPQICGYYQKPAPILPVQLPQANGKPSSPASASSTPEKAPSDGKKTIVIFMDTPNFIRTQRDHLKLVFDIKKLIKFLVGDRKLLKAYCFLPNPLKPATPMSELEEKLKAVGFTPIPGEEGEDIDEVMVSYIEKCASGKDSEIPTADVIISISGDHIFVKPLNNALINHNKEVEIFCGISFLSSRYIKAGFKLISPDLTLDIFDLAATRLFYRRDLILERQEMIMRINAAIESATPPSGPFVPQCESVTTPTMPESPREEERRQPMVTPEITSASDRVQKLQTAFASISAIFQDPTVLEVDINITATSGDIHFKIEVDEPKPAVVELHK